VTLEHHAGRVAAAGGLVVILVATLTPSPGGAAASAMTGFWCLVCGGHGGVDVTLNILLFVPFAIGLRLAGMPARWVVASSILLTVFIEGMQAEVIAGRDSSLSDLLTNTSGGIIGAVAASRLRRLVVPSTQVARLLTVVWAAVWLAVLLGTTWLLQPWSPRGVIHAAWGIAGPEYPRFSGRVLAASAGGAPLYPGVVPDSLRLGQRLAADRVELGFDAVVGRPRPYWTPALALLGRGGLIGAVFELRDDVVLELPTLAKRFQFRNPALRLDRGRPPEAGELVRITAGVRDRTLWIASSYGGERRYRELVLSPSFGWSLLLPFRYAYGPEVHFLTSLWIAGLLLPLGYWARWSRWPARARPHVAASLAAIVAAGLAAVPRLAGYPPVHRSEWLAAAIGLAAGWAVASRVTYLAGKCASPSTSESYSS
jgi:VanZ family protein